MKELIATLAAIIGIIAGCIAIYEFVHPQLPNIVPAKAQQNTPVTGQSTSFANPGGDQPGISFMDYGKGCVTVATQANESAIVTGDVTIDGTSYYDDDPTTGTLVVIGSNENRNVCDYQGGFNIEYHVPNSRLNQEVNAAENRMKHQSGCGSVCARVDPQYI